MNISLTFISSGDVKNCLDLFISFLITPRFLSLSIFGISDRRFLVLNFYFLLKNDLNVGLLTFGISAGQT